MAEPTLTATVREAHKEVARDANFEVFELAEMMRNIIVKLNATDGTERALRGICTRIAELSDVVYEAYLADDDDLNELHLLRRKLGIESRGA